LSQEFKNMFPNDFWYGFLIGVGLVAGVAFVARLIARARAKNSENK